MKNIGVNCVRCGSAANSADYRFPQLATVLFTDPPYCLLERRRVGGDLRDEKSIKRKLDHPTTTRFRDMNAYSTFTNKWSKCALDHMSLDARIIVWTNSLGKRSIMEAFQQNNCLFEGEYVWAKYTKNLPANSTKNEVLLRVYETALIFKRGGKLPLPPQDKSLPWSVITGYHEKEGNASNVHPHPCHKPFSALEPLVHAWTKPDDVILDCFAGSGALLAAAARLNRRNVHGLEISPDWALFANGVVETELKKANY